MATLMLSMHTPHSFANRAHDTTLESNMHMQRFLTFCPHTIQCYMDDGDGHHKDHTHARHASHILTLAHCLPLPASIHQHSTLHTAELTRCHTRSLHKATPQTSTHTPQDFRHTSPRKGCPRTQEAGSASTRERAHWHRGGLRRVQTAA